MLNVMRSMGSRLTRAGRRAFPLLVGLGLAGLALGCRERDRSKAPDGQVSQMQADRYIREAVLKSSEGVVLLPASKSGNDYDRVRLDEIAQNMRQPLAVCFLERAIRTIEKGEVDGEMTYVNVPEGQGKFRARIAGDGSVLRVEVLDSGFVDTEMEACVMHVIESRTFPQLRGQSQSHIDVVYWVSLGFHEAAKSPQFAEHMRKQQALAGVRAKRCLEGRVSAGDYEVEGLSLFASNGSTLINRITHGNLPSEVSRCVAQAFKAIVIAGEKEAFVRPASPRVRFTVREDGVVEVGDERWLQLVEMEERAKREQTRYELSGSEDAAALVPEPVGGPHDVTISGLEPVVEEDPDPPAGPAAAPAPVRPEGPVQDPSAGGIKLDLGPRR